MYIREPGHHGAFTLVELAKRMAVAVTRLEVRWIVVGHDGKLIGLIVPEIVAAAEPAEPDVVAFIGDNGNRINITVILFIRAVNDANTRANRPLTFRLRGVHCGCGKDA